MKKNTLIIFLTFLVLSCNQGVRSDKMVNCVTLEVPLSREDSPKTFDSLFKLKHLVALETNVECLIRRVSKIVFYKNNIYVLDGREKKIFTFNDKGDFLKCYNHLGQGPGEYVSLVDFTVKNDTLFLLDGSGAQLLQYSLADSLLCTLKIDKAEGLYVFSNGKFALNRKLGFADRDPDNSYRSYAFYDKSKKVHDRIPFNKHLCGYSFTHGEGANNFYTYDDSIFTLFPFNDTIYSVKENGDLNPYIAVQIGKEHINLSDDKKQVDKLRIEGITPSIHAFYKWNEYLFFSYFYKDKPSKCALAKKDGNILYHGSLTLDENLLPIHAVAYDTDDTNKLLLSVMRPFEILPIAKRNSGKSNILDELADKCLEDGNPIFAFYEPKF